MKALKAVLTWFEEHPTAAQRVGFVLLGVGIGLYAGWWAWA